MSSLEMQWLSADNWYRPIIGRFADNGYRLISTLVLADCCLVGKYKFLFLLTKVNKHEIGFRFR